jgi:hypothetical protein
VTYTKNKPSEPPPEHPMHHHEITANYARFALANRYTITITILHLLHLTFLLMDFQLHLSITNRTYLRDPLSSQYNPQFLVRKALTTR